MAKRRKDNRFQTDRDVIKGKANKKPKVEKYKNNNKKAPN